jgi:cytochrome c oxidase subunit 1
LFFYNLFRSYFVGKPAGDNPWRACSLEWCTPETPPGHGNWGKSLPVVYRWAYDFNVPGAVQDYLPQTMSPAEAFPQKKKSTRSRARKK